MLRALPLFVLVSCAGVQPGVADVSDKRCGTAGKHEVRLRYGVGESWPVALLSCEKARELVQKEAEPLEREWTFIFTSAIPGLAFNHQFDAVAAEGMTFTSLRTVEVSARHLSVLPHEVRHARNFELGRLDQEDR